jgi:hypothetical protein
MDTLWLLNLSSTVLPWVIARSYSQPYLEEEDDVEDEDDEEDEEKAG